MKRFFAALISIVFIFLVACKSPAEMLSDFGKDFKSNISKIGINVFFFIFSSFLLACQSLGIAAIKDIFINFAILHCQFSAK